MQRMDLQNPFGAPVYHEERVSSTMDAVRSLAAKGTAHGTVIAADFQESGRGRQGRPWNAEKGRNLMFSIFFDYRDFSCVPAALTLKTGLAVSLAVEDFLPALAGSVQVKWPNDIMLLTKPDAGGKGASQRAITGRKAAGILAEADGAKVYMGIGVNLTQRSFPEELRGKAGSLLSVLQEKISLKDVSNPADLANSAGCILSPNAPFLLLEKILPRLYNELKPSPALSDSGLQWKTRLENRLYKRGERVAFAQGAAGSSNIIQGTLAGIGEGGELLLIPEGAEKPAVFITGELQIY